MRKTYRAARIHAAPGEAALPDGALTVGDGRIVWVGPWSERASVPGGLGLVENLGDAWLAPGLVNAHVHLELSHLRGRTVSGQGFPAWARSLLANPLRGTVESAAEAAREMRTAGTAFAADICTRDPDLTAAALEAEGLPGFVCLEHFGFAPWDGETLPPAAAAIPEPVRRRRLAMAGHALYSTAPAVLQAAKAWCRQARRPFCLHLAEHPGEADLLLSGTGALADLLRERVLPRDFRPPGLSPVLYAETLGLLDETTLAVHCVHLDVEDIERLARAGASVCLCPRSNDFIGVGRADLPALLAAGLNVCLGTDSLASNVDLDLWNEARELKRRHPGLSLSVLLPLLTRNGAMALGVADDHGSLAPGRPAFFCVIPEDMRDD